MIVTLCTITIITDRQIVDIKQKIRPTGGTMTIKLRQMVVSRMVKLATRRSIRCL